MDVFDLVRQQASQIQQQAAEIARLRAATNTSEPAVRPARKKISLVARGRMSESWTPARRAAQSRRMSDYWALEQATKPDHPNGGGSGHASL
jgi:hypothetical protein